MFHVSIFSIFCILTLLLSVLSQFQIDFDLFYVVVHLFMGLIVYAFFEPGTMTLILLWSIFRLLRDNYSSSFYLFGSLSPPKTYATLS